MKDNYKPETAAFNKNPTKAGGYFVFVVWAVVPLRPAQGHAHTTYKNKIPPCRMVSCSQKLQIEKIA